MSSQRIQYVKHLITDSIASLVGLVVIGVVCAASIIVIIGPVTPTEVKQHVMETRREVARVREELTELRLQLQPSSPGWRRDVSELLARLEVQHAKLAECACKSPLIKSVK